MVALIKGSPYVAISAGQVSNRPTPSPFCRPRLKIERTNERTNDVKADAGCSTLFRVSLSRQRRSGPVAMLELSRLFELAGGTRGMTDRPFDLERALPPSPRFLSGCTLLSLSLYLSLSLSTPFTELIGKSIGGDGRRKNKSEEGAKEKRSPARIRRSSRSLRSSPIFSFPFTPREMERYLHNDRSDRSLPSPSPSSTLATTQARIRSDCSSSRFAFRLKSLPDCIVFALLLCFCSIPSLFSFLQNS